MRYTRLEFNEHFVGVLKRRNGWAATGYLRYCDRCSCPGPEAVWLGEPPEILLMLCARCAAHVQDVMGWEGAGYLGAAYWLTRAHFRLTPEAGQGPAGGP